MYASCRVLVRPPTTSPIWLVLTGVVYAIFALVKLLGAENRMALNALIFIGTSAFTWVAGTLPLQRTLPTRNVASSHQVTDQLVFYFGDV